MNFAQRSQDQTSSYKAFSTLDFTPKTPGDLGKQFNISLKVKYIGKPLSDKEVEEARKKAANHFSTNREVDMSDELVVERNGRNSKSPQMSLNTSYNWECMEEGKNLVVAYQVASALGGTITIGRDFRFNTLSFTMTVIAVEGHSREYEKIPETCALDRVAKVKGLKVISLTSDPEKILELHEDIINVDSSCSWALLACPANVDILIDVVMGNLVQEDFLASKGEGEGGDNSCRFGASNNFKKVGNAAKTKVSNGRVTTA